MTPAINCLKKAKIPYRLHSYDHDPNCSTFGKEAAEKLGICADRIFKTLVISVDQKGLGIAVVPVSGQLNLKTAGTLFGSKKTRMADKKDVERSTGYLPGGVSPIGQKKRLPTIIDNSALQFDTVFISAGRRGLQVELSPLDLAALTGAGFDNISK
jgi:Cys-tRNA(Pro)/Cys-tRNA(Cys) deacylase